MLPVVAFNLHRTQISHHELYIPYTSHITASSSSFFSQQLTLQNVFMLRRRMVVVVGEGVCTTNTLLNDKRAEFAKFHHDT